MNLKFEQYIDLTDINDSLELESYDQIAYMEKGNSAVEARVEGDVRIAYKEETYRYMQNYPDELLKAIHDGKYDEYEIIDGNWFELFYYKDGSLLYTDVYDLENSKPYELFETMLDYLNYNDNKE